MSTAKVMNPSQPLKKSSKGRGKGVLAFRETTKPGPSSTDSLNTNTMTSGVESVIFNVNKVSLDGNHSSNSKTDSEVIDMKINCTNTNKDYSCSDLRKDTSNITNLKVAPKVPQKGEIIAKYNYKANPAQPGGFPELSLKQGEHVMLVCKGHAPTQNSLWWEVRNVAGDQGYVPANYCLELEEKVG